MIRRISERERRAAVQLLSGSPLYNLYMLSNLEQIGFDAEFCEFWGDFADDDRQTLRGLLNRYMTGWSVYGSADTDWDALASVVDECPIAATRLQDNPGGAESLLPYIRRYSVHEIAEEEMMALRAADFRPIENPRGYTIRRATLDDVDGLAEFYATAGSMSRSRAGVERPLRNLRVWIATGNGDMRAAALTNAEIESAAMVGGVYTEPASRNLGLGRAVCSALCAELLRAGKQPVLYWKEPAAGVIYRGLGFRPIGVWRSVWLQPA